MKTVYEVSEWIDAAEEEFGDSSEPICQIFCRWVEPLILYRGNEIAAGMIDGVVHIRLGGLCMLPIQIAEPGGVGIDNEGVPHYEPRHVAGGLWHLYPSLNVPTLIHAFVTFYDVPPQVPWRSKILVVKGQHLKDWGPIVPVLTMGGRR